jgi:hypothetical protein
MSGPPRDPHEVLGEWADAVAAIAGTPGAPSAEAVARLIAIGDRLAVLVAEAELEQFDPIRDGWLDKRGRP